LCAGLATLSGPRHGGACDRVDALVDEVHEPKRAREVLVARMRRGDAIPGFGHPLYPKGDPRAALLLETARRAAKKKKRHEALEAIGAEMARLNREPPTLDFGLVAIAAALELEPGAAGALFAVGRAAG